MSEDYNRTHQIGGKYNEGGAPTDRTEDLNSSRVLLPRREETKEESKVTFESA